jgi:hypothetical protein
MYFEHLFHRRILKKKKPIPFPITDHGHGKKWRETREKKKMHAMRGSKDLYSRILGGIGKGSEGPTQLQYF